MLWVWTLLSIPTVHKPLCTGDPALCTLLPQGSAALELLQEHSQEKTTCQTGLDWDGEFSQPHPSHPGCPVPSSAASCPCLSSSVTRPLLSGVKARSQQKSSCRAPQGGFFSAPRRQQQELCW